MRNNNNKINLSSKSIPVVVLFISPKINIYIYIYIYKIQNDVSCNYILFHYKLRIYFLLRLMPVFLKDFIFLLLKKHGLQDVKNAIGRFRLEIIYVRFYGAVGYTKYQKQLAIT